MSSGATHNPDVSVIIPTRDRVEYLRRCLRTVLGQIGVTLEVVVVDDGSKDSTASYIDELADRRVHLLRRTVPHGVAAARNGGLEQARGGWVAFIDDDDLWAPDKLVSQLEAATNHKAAGWICTGSVTVDENLRLRAVTAPIDVDPRQLLSYNFIPGGASGTMVRTQLARAVGGFDANLSSMADWDMWIRLALKAPMATLWRPLVARCEHDHGLSGDPAGVRAEFEHIVDKYRAVRIQNGVKTTGAALNWCARRQVESGRARAAARLYAHVAYSYRDFESLGRAVAAVARPALLRRRWERQARGTLVSPWREEAEAWLTPLRS